MSNPLPPTKPLEITYPACQVAIATLTAENAALRELMNCYNLGGWTDSLSLIKERDRLREELARWKARYGELT